MEAVTDNVTGSRRHSPSAPLRESSQALPALSGISGGKAVIFTKRLNNAVPLLIPVKPTSLTPPKKADRGAGSASINLASLADPRFSPRSGDVFKSISFILPRPQPTHARAASLVDAKAHAAAQFPVRIMAPLDAFGFHELIFPGGVPRVIAVAPPKPQASGEQATTGHGYKRNAGLNTALIAEASHTPALLSWMALSCVAMAME